HVEALNLIEIEFNGKSTSDRRVVERWRIYLDHLNETLPDLESPDYSQRLEAWSHRGYDKLAQLLKVMAEALGYDFDEVNLKRSVYSPRGYAELEAEQKWMRSQVLKILNNELHVPIRIVNFPE